MLITYQLIFQIKKTGDDMVNYWIGVASLDHVTVSVDGGFCQLCHGKQPPLSKMKFGDWIIYYSPKVIFGEKTPLQKFTAIGKLIDETSYQCEMLPNFIPWRRNVEFIKNVEQVSIHDILDELEFVEDKKHYGAKFRFGHFKINEHDFGIIAEKMGVPSKMFKVY